MKICKKCGTDFTDEFSTCPKCGETFVDVKQQENEIKEEKEKKIIEKEQEIKVVDENKTFEEIEKDLKLQKEKEIYEIEQKKSSQYYEKRKKKIIRRHGWQTFCNVVYIIFIGLWNTIATIGLGVCYCVTLIGIPFGIAYFKSIKLVITPLDKRVVTHYRRHPVLNTIWLICGGLIISFIYKFIGLLLYLPYIYRIGQIFIEIGNYFFAPFGADILYMYEFKSEEEKKLAYTYHYMRRNKVSYSYEDEIMMSKNKVRAVFKFPCLMRTLLYPHSFMPNEKPFNGKIKFLKNVFLRYVMLIIFFIIGWYIIYIPESSELKQVSIELFFLYNSMKILFIFLISFSIVSIILELFEIPNAMAMYHGYINVPEMINLEHLNPNIKNCCKGYYMDHSAEIDKFIEAEYVY